MSLEACGLVALGGFLGGISRFFISGLTGRRTGHHSSTSVTTVGRMRLAPILRAVPVSP